MSAAKTCKFDTLGVTFKESNVTIAASRTIYVEIVAYQLLAMSYNVHDNGVYVTQKDMNETNIRISHGETNLTPYTTVTSSLITNGTTKKT